MTSLFNPRQMARTLGASLAAIALGGVCLLAAAGPAKAMTNAVQTQSASAIIGGE